MKIINKTLLATAVASSFLVSGCMNSDKKAETPEAPSAQISLRVLETSDLHANVMDFNYISGKEDITIGLARTASLVHEARMEVTNSVLVDNGDLIQGSAMGDYMASVGLVYGETHPVYKAMNTLDYVVGNIGNHEFNYGLEFLEEATNDANFPYINANVYIDDADGNDTNDVNYFKPYLIQEKTVIDSLGNEQTIKIGYIGFVPPQIMQWDKANLTGKVIAKDIIETANKFVPQMKAEGADVIVAIPHSGIGSTETPADMDAENATFALSLVDGIDAITFGHSHSVFPSSQFADIENIDVEKGTINGVASVMPGRWGDNLGVVDLVLEQVDGNWTVVDSSSDSRPIYTKNEQGDKVELVSADHVIHRAVENEHLATLEYVNAPIGQADADMFSFLTLVQDDPSVQIVSDAQIDYVETQLDGTEFGDIPVLSAAAPFKAGGRHSAVSDSEQYVMVPRGDLTYKNATDLYLYPNTVVAVKLTGADVKEWLECSANMFNQVDVTSAEPQYLINWTDHRTYNFDVIDGVDYEIDVTQPTRYDGDCGLQDANAERIVNLSYNDNGTIITGEEFLTKEFIVASNNYRAFGGKFAGTGPEYVVLEAPDENRQVLSNYITAQTEANGVVSPSADNNWKLKLIDNAQVTLDIRFETSEYKDADGLIDADAFIEDNKQYPMTKIEKDEFGFAVYGVDLTVK